VLDHESAQLGGQLPVLPESQPGVEPRLLRHHAALGQPGQLGRVVAAQRHVLQRPSAPQAERPPQPVHRRHRIAPEQGPLAVGGIALEDQRVEVATTDPQGVSARHRGQVRQVDRFREAELAAQDADVRAEHAGRRARRPLGPQRGQQTVRGHQPVGT
jgi:hypothetical protein